MIDYRRFTLDCGLRCILSYDPGVSMAAVDVLYNTGSRDEQPSLTGVAHLFEHLMFGGSVHVPDFDLELSAAGGISNAWTSNDFTNFYDVLPAVNIETALHLESDRMLSLSFEPQSLETQRSVVVEEFKQQCLNAPYGDLMHHVRRALYSSDHPYSWPVIGLSPEHILAVTPDEVRRRFNAYYSPCNAVLSIVGNITYERGRELLERWFGDLPSRPVAARTLPAPGFPPADVDLSVTGNAPVPLVVLAVPMDPYGTRDYLATDCITDILSAGKSTRLYRRLVADGDGTFLTADASVLGSEHEGLMLLTGTVSDSDDATMNRALALLRRELALLGGDDSVTPHELERTFNRFESTFELDNQSVVTRAYNLALAEMHGSDINDTVSRQRSLTAADIRRVAARLAATPSLMLRYRS